LLVVLMLISAQPRAEALRGDSTLNWNCGLQLHLLVENNDYWTTGVVSDIYVVVTLLDTGLVTDFLELIVTICVITERVDLGTISVLAPWDEPGDKVHVVGHFNITADLVNNAGWDIYMAHFYVQLNCSVRIQGGETLDLYSHKDVYTINVSTLPFIVLWPFPPIVLMMLVYWIGYFGLKRFNRRYSGLAKPRF